MTAYEDGERAKIEATDKGTEARVAAIDAAIKDEQSKNLQSTSFFRDMMNMRVQAVLEESESEQKARDEATKQQIAASQKASEEQNKHSMTTAKAKNPNFDADANAQKAELAKEYQNSHDALLQQLQDTQNMGKEKVQEQQRIMEQIEQLEQEHQAKLDEIDQKQVESEREAAASVANAWGQSLLKVAEGHERMSKIAEQAADSMISNAMKAAIMTAAGAKDEQLSNAKAAASGAMAAVAKIPVVGPALAIPAGAMMFAAAMAFAEGGTVPGMGNRDNVPAMLTPGEGIVPNSMMDNLNKMAREGGLNQKAPSTHVHMHNTYHVNTIDGDGMQDALEKHSDQLHKHFDNAVRRMNR